MVYPIAFLELLFGKELKNQKNLNEKKKPITHQTLHPSEAAR